MSTTNSRRIAHTFPSVDYVMFGPLNSEVYKKHKAEGTDRAAAIRCDCGDPFAFVERAQQLRDAFGRKVESISLIQSFESSELDPRVPAYVQQINDSGYELGKRLAPHSDVLVVTHTDSKGGHGHNHLYILNHDNVTGRALRRDFRHFAVAEVNDDLMRECNLRVVERGSRDQTKYWEHVRESETIAAFDLLLGDRLMTTRLDDSWYDQQTWERALSAVGIEIKEERHLIKGTDADGEKIEHESVGWTYRMLDDTRVDEGIKPRVRRRKASSLGDEFTYKSLQAEFEARQAQRAAQQAAEQAQQSARPVLNALQQEWLKRVVSTYDSAFDARMAMTKAGVAMDDQNAVLEAWQEAKTAESGVAVADHVELVETAENSRPEAQTDAVGAAESATDPEVGAKRVERGRDLGASNVAEGADILEDEHSGSWPNGTGSRSASRAHNAPNSGSRLATSVRQMGAPTSPERRGSGVTFELELLELRYQLATEGATWGEGERFEARVRIELLKDDLGLSDTAEPSTEAVIAEYEQQVLRRALPDQHETEPSSPPASSGTPSAPPGLDSVELHDEAAPVSPPGSSGPSPAPPGLVDAGSPSAPASVKPTAPYRSGVWELAEQADDPKATAAFAAIARFDEESREVLMAGGRIPNSDVVKVSKGNGDKWQRTQPMLHPVVRHEMKLRAERMAERRYEFEQVGKPLKDRLEEFKTSPNFSLDEYHDVQAKLAESNRTVKAIEQRMNAGIYEDGSKWRPGQPVPSRQYSKVMTARLHQIADDALAEQSELEAQQDEQLGG